MTRNNDWIILRCSSVSTLRLADSLVNSGIDAWTPREEVQKVVRGKVEWAAVPMYPSFVFADANRMTELSELSRNPSLSYMVWDAGKRRMVTKGHPYFRLFRVGEECRPIPDSELDAIRRIVGRRERKPRGKPREYHVGDRVKLTEGASEGLRGVVIATQGKNVTVSIPGSNFDFTVPSYRVLPALDEPARVGLHTSQLRIAA